MQANLRGFFIFTNSPRGGILTAMEKINRKMTLPCGINYKVIRSSRKTIAAEVNIAGEVIVRVPMWVSDESVRAFVESKSDWIERTVKKVTARRMERQAALPPPFTGADGDKLPYLGTLLTALHRDGGSEPRVEGDMLILPPGFDLSAVIQWLRARAADELNARLQRYGELLGAGWKSARQSDARTRWGMCSGKNSLNLSWRLIFCTPEAIDYVVAHELCHIKHKNHGRNFYAELERVFPERKRAERWLKDNFMLINFL